jgi:uncharacterized membrane protein YgdD (TMEM256/DUF423 family)
MTDATRLFTTLGASAMALAVVLGAFGAHALKARFTSEQLDVWDTAVQYHVYHALGLFVVAGLCHLLQDAAMVRLAGWVMVLGIVVFSGSLYVLTISGVRWLGAITPLGGVALIAAWLMLAWGTWRGSGG